MDFSKAINTHSVIFRISGDEDTFPFSYVFFNPKLNPTILQEGVSGS